MERNAREPSRGLADLLSRPEWQWLPGRLRLLSGLQLGLVVAVPFVAALFVLGMWAEVSRFRTGVRWTARAVSLDPPASPASVQPAEPGRVQAAPVRRRVFGDLRNRWEVDREWQHRFVERLKAHWNPPPRPAGAGALEVRLRLVFRQSGEVVEARLDSSGSPAFDRSVEEALRASLPVPSLHWLRSGATAGMLVTFTEEDVRDEWQVEPKVRTDRPKRREPGA